jgi:Ca-activated chloride channel homolog
VKHLSSMLLVLASCGSENRREPEPPPHPPAPEPAPPRPAAGIDLDGPGELDELPSRSPPRELALGADRAAIPIAAPVPPRGTAVGFTFAEGRRGWIARLPEQRQLPSVAYGDGRVYVSGGFESTSFFALDAATGNLVWAATQLEDNGPAAPVFDGDDVLFNTESCTVFALDARTGRRKWSRYLGDPTLAQLALADGVVYAAYPDDADGGHHLGAFRVASGAPVWSRPIDGEVLATPVIAGDAVYVSTLGGFTVRFDRRTGKPRWRARLSATTAPWVAGDELFVTRRAGAREQTIVVDAGTGAVLREHRTSSSAYAGDVPRDLRDWKRVWAYEGSRPIVEGGIHHVALGDEVTASDARTGALRWRRFHPAARDRRLLGSIALAGSTVVVASRDGNVFGLDADTGSTRWAYGLGHPVTAEPIIARGWIYAATTDGHVIGLEVADRSLDGWHMFGGNPQKNGLVTVPQAPEPRDRELATATPAAPVDIVAATQAELDAAPRPPSTSPPAPRTPAPRTPVVLDPACDHAALCGPYH